MRVVLCYPLEPRHLEQMAMVAPQAELVNAGQQRVAQEILEADVFCGHSRVPVPWGRVVQRGRLRWIHSAAAGLDHCLTPEVIASDILVTSSSGLFADQVAEQTIALLTGLLRDLPTAFRYMARHHWARHPTRDLHGATIGILGLGGNGRRIAEVLAPYRTRILATDLFPRRRPPQVEQLWAADRLGELLPLVDVLILCVPLNAQTRGMIAAPQLAAMKPGSILVNVARGQCVVESDLVAALQSGHLGGAALDVTEREPLPASSPLWDLPNVIVTPHVGAQSARRYDDTTDFFCRNLARYQQGQRLLNLVDKQLGFPVPQAEDP
jgi:phosphoglycerate dehydrogenase-like enzyme